MNKLKRIFIILFIGLIVFTTTSFAEKGKINAPNGLIFRKEASKSAEIITTISNGSVVEIIEKTGEWYKAKYKDNEGYLFAEYVKLEEPMKEPEGKSEENAVAEEPANEQIEKPKVDFTEPLYPQKQNAKNDLKVYLIPSITSQVIANIAKDTEITINYRVSNWVNVTCGDINGWVRKYFTEEKSILKVADNKTSDTAKGKDDKEEKPVEKPAEKKNEESEKNILNNKKGYVNVTNSANIREEANTSSKVVDRLLRNTEVQVVGEEGDFYKIEWENIKGYMAKSLISEKPV